MSEQGTDFLSNKLVRAIIGLLVLFGSAFAVFMFVESRESNLTPLETHEALAQEVQEVGWDIRQHKLETSWESVRSRIWGIEMEYNCRNTPACKQDMTPRDRQEYERLLLDLDKLNRKLGK